MFHNEGCLLGVQDKPLHHTCCHHTLFHVQVSGRFIDQVDVCWLSKGKDQGNSLQLTPAERLDLVVCDLIDQHGLGHIRLKLRMQKRVANLHEEQILHGSFELRADGLWLVRHIELWQFIAFFEIIGLQQAREHSNEGGLATTVLPQQNQDLRRCKIAGLNVQSESAHLLGHHWVLGVVHAIQLGRIQVLGDLEGQGHLTKSQVFGGNETIQENVDAFSHTEGHGHHTIGTCGAPQATNEVGQIVQHR
mmetsp:Transcript_38336/g.47483  ORF Transcript_38336/g.47483 Transcript_38336/m.47483 type:complete len:248 (+) Transcript_38336:362-1105(+)